MLANYFLKLHWIPANPSKPPLLVIKFLLNPRMIIPRGWVEAVWAQSQERTSKKIKETQMQFCTVHTSTYVVFVESAHKKWFQHGHREELVPRVFCRFTGKPWLLKKCVYFLCFGWKRDQIQCILRATGSHQLYICFPCYCFVSLIEMVLCCLLVRHPVHPVLFNEIPIWCIWCVFWLVWSLPPMS
jgi:hypothetical protein